MNFAEAGGELLSYAQVRLEFGIILQHLQEACQSWQELSHSSSLSAKILKLFSHKC